MDEHKEGFKHTSELKSEKVILCFKEFVDSMREPAGKSTLFIILFLFGGHRPNTVADLVLRLLS